MTRMAVPLLVLFASGSVIFAGEPAVRSDAIDTLAGSAALVIPAAGNLQGGGGTHFRTDVTLVNHSDLAARVAVTWIEREVTSTSSPVYLDIPPRTVRVFEDFVGDVLGRTGLGSLLIRTVDSSGEPLEQGSIDAFARIWTPQSGREGTVSQPMYALPEIELRTDASRPAYILGMKQNDHFRSNLGIVNLDTTAAQSYTVHAVGTTGSTTFRVDLAPISMKQVPVPGEGLGDFYLVVVPDTGLLNPFGESSFTAYGSTVDNITGDAWSVAATFGFGNP